MDTHELSRAQIDRHFTGRIRPAEEQAMRTHCGDCEDCRRYYERQQLFSELSPGALPERERIARGLGLPTPGRLPRASWLVGTLAAAAALLLVALPRLLPSDAEAFAARGTLKQAPITLEVYRLADGRSTPARGAIRLSDELAFAYTNRAERAYLMVFGVDEHAHVFWFQPTWNDAMLDPESVSIVKGPGLRELSEAVSHDFDGQSLTLFGLFSQRPLHVRDVERELLAARSQGTALSDRFQDADVVEQQLRLEP